MIYAAEYLKKEIISEYPDTRTTGLDKILMQSSIEDVCRLANACQRFGVKTIFEEIQRKNKGELR